MRRWELLLWLGLLVACCTPAYASGHDLNYEGWQDHYWEGSCSNPANQDRWRVRKPTEEEALAEGSHILVFEYFNSDKRCSDTQSIGLRMINKRIATMHVETLGEEDAHREKIWLEDIPESGYTSFGVEIQLDDGGEPGIIFLYPMMF